MKLEALLKAATPGPWTGHNMVHADEDRQMTPEEIGEYICNSVKMGSPDRFLFVSGKHDDGGDADICHTGNGPRGPANTALIALAPTLAAALIEARDALNTADAEICGISGGNPEGGPIDHELHPIVMGIRSAIARIDAITRTETK